MATPARLNALLAAGLAGVLGAVWLAGRPTDPEGGPAAVSTLDPAAVRQVEVARPGEAPVRLERVEGGWQVGPPFALPGNRVRIETLVTIARAVSLDRFPAGDDALSRYELDPPRLEVRLDGRVFALGGTEPIDGRRYLLHEGEVHLVTDAWFGHVAGDAAAYVSPFLIPSEAVPVRLELPAVRLENRDGRWHREPPSATFSADHANRLIDRWRAAQGIQVQRLRPGREWREAVSVTLDDGTVIRLGVSTGKHDVVFGRADVGVQYHLPRAAAEPLLTLP